MSPDTSGLLPRSRKAMSVPKRKSPAFTGLSGKLPRRIRLLFNHVVYATFQYVWLFMDVRLDNIAKRICRTDTPAAHDLAVERIEFVGGLDDPLAQIFHRDTRFAGDDERGHARNIRRRHRRTRSFAVVVAEPR